MKQLYTLFWILLALHWILLLMWSTTHIFVFGISSGIFLFLLLFVKILILDIYRKNKSDRKINENKT